MTEPAPKSLGLVLSGGGARGAYEVGVLSYIFGELSPEERRGARLDIISGTSVGAVNAAFMAGVSDNPRAGIHRLSALWDRLELADVLQFGVKQALGLHRVLLGGSSATGLFDAAPLAHLVGSGMDWRVIHRNQRAGHFRALTVTATHVGSGRPVVFVDAAAGVPLPTGLPAQVVVRQERILPHHVLASAAIPIVFPPVRIRSDLYCDGGLRLNTPMAPAVHMGVEKMLIIGVSGEAEDGPALPAGRFPGAPFLLGKVLNAFLLDHVNTDLEKLGQLNRILEDGISAYGPDFVETMNARARARGAAPLRIVDSLVVRPSADLGELAGDYLRQHQLRFGKILGRSFLRLLDVGEGASSDLASYLLFDGGFARILADLGRQDAARERDRILAFFA